MAFVVHHVLAKDTPVTTLTPHARQPDVSPLHYSVEAADANYIFAEGTQGLEALDRHAGQPVRKLTDMIAKQSKLPNFEMATLTLSMRNPDDQPEIRSHFGPMTWFLERQDIYHMSLCSETDMLVLFAEHSENQLIGPPWDEPERDEGDENIDSRDSIANGTPLGRLYILQNYTNAIRGFGVKVHCCSLRSMCNGNTMNGTSRYSMRSRHHTMVSASLYPSCTKDGILDRPVCLDGQGIRSINPVDGDGSIVCAEFLIRSCCVGAMLSCLTRCELQG